MSNERTPDGESDSVGLRSADVRQLLRRMTEHRRTIGGFRGKANKQRTQAQKIADLFAHQMGTMPFLVAHIAIFVIWFVLNLHLIPWLRPFDSFPFGLIMLVLTLEQSLLIVFVLLSENRSSDLTELRAEIDLQINILNEEEVSKLLQGLHLIGSKLNISEIMNDSELRVMETSVDYDAMEKETVQEQTGDLPHIDSATSWTQA